MHELQYWFVNCKTHNAFNGIGCRLLYHAYILVCQRLSSGIQNTTAEAVQTSPIVIDNKVELTHALHWLLFKITRVPHLSADNLKSLYRWWTGCFGTWCMVTQCLCLLYLTLCSLSVLFHLYLLSVV